MRPLDYEAFITLQGVVEPGIKRDDVPGGAAAAVGQLLGTHRHRAHRRHREKVGASRCICLIIIINIL